MKLKRPARKPKVQEGYCKLRLVGIEPSYGVERFDNPDADVVDLSLETEKGYVIRQRETFSYHKNSNFGKLVRKILNIDDNAVIEEIDTDEVLDKEIIGEIVHYSKSNGDIYERAKNFKSLQESKLQGKIG